MDKNILDCPIIINENVKERSSNKYKSLKIQAIILLLNTILLEFRHFEKKKKNLGH